MGYTPPHEAGPKAIEAAERAVELDDGSAATHRALAGIRTWTEWNWAGAEVAWRRALELEPKSADHHAGFSHFLVVTGRIDEAVQHGERALELDPFNAKNHAFYAVVLYNDRRYDEAIAAARNALAIQPRIPLGRNVIRGSLFAKGMRDEWLAHQREWIARDPELAEAFEQGLAEAGHEGAFRRLAGILTARLEEAGGIVAPVGVYPLFVAKHYLYAGDYDIAMDFIEKSFEVHDPNLPYIAPEPLFDPLRSNPRFQDLLRRMNLPTISARSDPDEQR
jgi:tetratricopeptide (TPR) repeat protein